MTNSSPHNSDITTALSEEGLGEQPWWVEQWMELINYYRFKKRLDLSVDFRHTSTKVLDLLQQDEVELK